MRLAIGTFLLILGFAQFDHAQTNPDEKSTEAGAPTTVGASVVGASSDSYTVFNATVEQEAALRAQIRFMRPDVLPLRVFFVPHWKYLAAARDFHLHVPTGYGSLMFTICPAAPYSSITTATRARIGWATGLLTNLATWSRTAPTKQTPKKLPVNFASASKSRVHGRASLIPLRNARASIHRDKIIALTARECYSRISVCLYRERCD